MCIFHKSEYYGGLLIKQKDKQRDKQEENFALKFVKLLPFDFETILSAIIELVEEGVLEISGDLISQRRMVKDGEISLQRSAAGKKGGGNPILFKQIDKQENKQNTVIENEINISFTDFWNLYDKKVGDKTKLTKKWVALKDDQRVLIMEHLPKYKKSKPDKQFRKDPETYLNNSGWLDEIIGLKTEDKQQEGVSDILKRHGK